MAITDLTNTIWYVPSGWSATAGYGVFNINYDFSYSTVSETNMSKLSIGYQSSDPPMDQSDVAQADYIEFIPIFYGTGPNNAITITINGGDDATNASLIYWLETYGTQLKVTDLTDTSWTVNAGWEAESGYGSFSISYRWIDAEFLALNLGYIWGGAEEPILTPTANYIVGPAGSGVVYTSDQNIDITFTGGTDATNIKLIAWLTRYGAVKEPAIASIIKGALVSNATAYSLYEKITTGETVEYIFKTVNTEINFDLRTLDLSAGTHTFVVQATAQGYESSDYSNEVTYTVAPSLTSPTIEISESTLNIYDEEGLATSYDILVDGEVKATVEKVSTVSITLKAQGGYMSDTGSTTYIKFGAAPTSSDDWDYYTPNGEGYLVAKTATDLDDITIDVIPTAYIWCNNNDGYAGYSINDGSETNDYTRVGVGYTNATNVTLSDGDNLWLRSAYLD